jgi:UDP-3-O-[3-hydroxymyristoyl] glucosamine N-acyltransferase
MSEPQFLPPGGGLSLSELIDLTGALAPEAAERGRKFRGAAPIEDALNDEFTYFDHPQKPVLLTETEAGACFIHKRYAGRLPAATLPLFVDSPAGAFAILLARLYPLAVQPQPYFGTPGVNPGASIHPEARLESGVIVDPGAVIGPQAEIGSGTLIGANCVIGPKVRIGRDCKIGAQVTLSHALLGNRVTLHPGARIGQDGSGFFEASQILCKMPHAGRVILQDGVEIGANCTIDRGTIRDTVIGEGSRIDNLVQIANDVSLGRDCLVFGQSFIGEGSEFGDGVIVGGQAGFAPYARLGAGTRIAPQSGVNADSPAGRRLAGTPAQPLWQWLRALGRREFGSAALGRGHRKNTK